MKPKRKKPPKNYFANRVYNRINRKNRNALICFVGETGVGKSYTAIRICKLVDHTFHTGRICFNNMDFLKLLKEGDEYGKLKKGMAVMYDEFGVSHSSRSWYESTNKLVNFILQTFRRQNLLVCFTVPDQSFVDVQARKLFHYMVENIDIDYEGKKNICKVFQIKPNPSFNKEPYKIYFRKRRGLGKKQKLPRMKFALGDKDILRKYEGMKRKFSEELYAKSQKEFEAKEEHKKKKGHELDGIKPNSKCTKCGYEWHSIGKTVRRCPRCMTSKVIVAVEAK